MAGTPLAFNGSGRAPAGAKCEWYRERNFNEIPEQSPHAVTVPGAIDAWCRLLADHGTKDLYEVLMPAIRLAEHGFRVTPRVAYDWARKVARLSLDPDTARQYIPDGNAPKPGDRFRQPQLAATLRKISRGGCAAFYEGEVAAEIVAKLRSLGGLHRPEDFAAHAGNYVKPISALYRGFEIYECPPNGQGLATLIMLRALSGYDLSGPGYHEADCIHLLAEVTKAAYGLRDLYFCDPEHHPVKVADFRSDRQEERIRQSIHPDAALPETGRPEIEHTDTVYVAVVDWDRNAVSLINSLFSSFGSGLYARKSGVLLHNCGHSFRVCPGHPNAICTSNAADAHDHSRDDAERGAGRHAVRHHGRRLPGRGTSAFRIPDSRSRSRPAGGGRGSTLLRLRRRPSARKDDLRRYRHGACPARP